MRFLLVLVAVVMIEAAAFATISDAVGGVAAVLGLAATTAGGFVLLARQGRATLRRLDAALRGAAPPGAISRELWLALTAVLLAAPGYVSDALGILLLVPAVRMLLRDLVFLRLVTVFGRPPARRDGRGVIEGDWRDETKPPPTLPP